MKDWVWNIFIMTTTLAFIELIMPGGGMQKYLKFIFSLFIIAVIIYPFGEKASKEISFTLPVDNGDSVEWHDDGTHVLERITKTQTLQLEDIYQNKLGEIKETENSVQKSGISLPWADIYSIDGEESK